jgi:hypothetical protein
MIGPTRTDWCARLFLAGTAVLAFMTMTIASPPAHAFWIGFGVPFPGYYYGPGPYYGYPPPPAYYYPPAGYYPPQGAYPPPLGAAPSAYTPGAPAPSYAPAAGVATSPAAAPAGPRVTYTDKPAFTNSAGQTCREYKTSGTTGGRPVDVYGTACRQADGQWRVVN